MLTQEQRLKLKAAGYGEDQISAYEKRKFGAETKSLPQVIGETIKNRFKNVVEAGARFQEGKQTLGETVLQTGGQIAGGLGEVAFETAAAGVKAITPEPVEQAVKSAGVAILNTPTGQAGIQAIQKGADTYNQWKAQNPRAALDLEAVVNIASILPAGKASQVAGKTAMEAGELGAKAIATGAEQIGKVAKPAAGQVGKVAEFGVAQATGLSPTTIKNVIKNPELFSAKELAKIDRDSLVSKVVGATTKRFEDLQETGKGYNTIKQSSARAGIGEQDIIDYLGSRGISVQNGKINVDLSSDIQLSNADISGLEDVLSLLKGKQDLSAKEVLNLRTRLSNLSAFGEGKTNASKTIAKEIRAKVDSVAKEQIPGLKELDAKYAPEVAFLSKIRKDLFNADGKLKDNATSKLANLTGKGKEQVLVRMEKIVPGIRQDVNILKAIEDIETAQGQKVGTYWRGLAGGGVGFTAGGPVGAIIGAIIASPSVAVSLLRTYAKARKISSEVIDKILGKLRTGKKLDNAESVIMKEAITEGANKLSKRK